MQTNPSHTGLDNPDVAHERTDVSLRALLAFLAALLVAAVVIHIAVWLLMRAWQRPPADSAPSEAPPYEAAPFERPWLADPGTPPPGDQFDELVRRPGTEPLLQVDPVHEMDALRARENETLRRWGWQETPAGTLELPVDRALRLLEARGVVVDPAPPGP
jgi:hypothetical protein